MSEVSDVQKPIIDRLKEAGCIVLRLNSGGRVGRVQLLPKGTPDLLALVPGGLALWIEVKTEDGELSDKQREFHSELRRYGQIVEVVRSVSEAMEALNRALSLTKQCS